MYINKTPSELMNSGDYHEGYLYQEALNTLRFKGEQNPTDNEDFFEIPAYIREEAQKDYSRDLLDLEMSNREELPF